MLEGFSNQVKGTICCLVGVLVVSPDGLLVREVSMLPALQVIFYKYLFLGLVLSVALVASEGKRSIEIFSKLGWLGWGTGLLWGFSNFAINYAYENTNVASVLVINASNPIFSALGSYLLLKEKMKIRTIIATIVCFIAIIVIFLGQSGGGENNALGLISALLASISIGFYLVLLRYQEISTG